MKTAIALRHVHFEDLGILESLLEEQGYAVTYVDAMDAAAAQTGRPEPDLLIVLGGPIGAYDEDTYPLLADELQWIERRMAQHLPLLGICLGAQLIARAMGARVYATGAKHIGFGPLRLTDEGRSSMLAGLEGIYVLHWHGDTFDLPEGARLLAYASNGTHQAFSVGRHVLALQCHLEADMARFEPWLVGHAVELRVAGINPRALRAQALDVGNRLATAARAAFLEWTQGLEVASTAAAAGGCEVGLH